MSLQSLKNQLFLSMQTNGRPTTGQLHECVFGLPSFYLFIYFYKVQQVKPQSWSSGRCENVLRLS